MMIKWGPYWWCSSSLDDKMISKVLNLWRLFEEGYHQNIPKKDTLNLLVNLVSRGAFEDILTNLNSSRVWVSYTDWLHKVGQMPFSQSSYTLKINRLKWNKKAKQLLSLYFPVAIISRSSVLHFHGSCKYPFVMNMYPTLCSQSQ